MGYKRTHTAELGRRSACALQNISVCNANNTDMTDIIWNFDMLDVGYTCNVSTSVNLTFLDYESTDGHISSYEKDIRLCPVESCASCNRFLFRDQVVHLTKLNDVANCLIISENCSLCRSCHNN